jgi:hypothetical protein
MGILTLNSHAALLRAVAFGAIVVASGPAPLRSQTLGAPTAAAGSESTAWLMRWSPLRLNADLPRELPGAAASLPSLLTLPAPRVGSFWTAGNPGSLPWNVQDRYTQFRLASNREVGDYRRPLDGGTDTRTGGTVFGWTDLGANGAAIGRVVADHLNQDNGAHSDVVLPHSSNPFVVLDTVGDALSGMVARVEGAGGWKLGNLGLGLGLGYDGREVRTAASPAPRQYRVSVAGATAGINYALMQDLIEIGVFGSWQQVAQTTYVSSRAADTRVYLLRGYFNPLRIDLNGQVYHRRFDRKANALGASLAGRVGPLEWAAYAQRDGLTERQSVFMEDEPPTDEWKADGWTGGMAGTAVLGDSSFLATVWGGYSGVNGEARRWDLNEVSFNADEAEWYLSGELRLLPQRGWTAAVRVGTVRQSRKRWDYLARVGSDINSWTVTVAAEVARTLAWGVSASLGVGYTRHSPWGSIPTPGLMEPAYQSWIAPELSIYLNQASSVAGFATLLWSASSRLSLWASGSLTSLSGNSGFYLPPLLPEGSRRHSSIELGLTLLGG